MRSFFLSSSFSRFALPLALCVLAGPSPAAQLALPQAAHELSALPDGGWLALTGRGLQLIDAAGRPRAEWPVRGAGLDARVDGNAGVALVIDANTQRITLIAVDLARHTLTPITTLPDAGQSVAAACLFRDAQAQLQAFVIGKNGIAQQSVLVSTSAGSEARQVREFAVAPDAEQCRVDDARQRLLVSDSSGVWAHPADAEGSPRREAVALRRPHGPLVRGKGALAVLEGGRVAIVDPGKPGLMLLARDARSGAWRSGPAPAMPRLKDPDQLAVLATGGRPQLAVRDDDTGRWTLLAVTAGAAAEAPPFALPVVMPRAQTEPVAQFGDAADDPAIWVHPVDRASSLVLGTDKKRGIGVYDLQGGKRQFLEVGRVNNIDVRQDVRLGAERVDIAAATQRDDNSVLLLRISPQGEVAEWARLPTGFKDIYGICLHRSPDAALQVFVNDKSGRYLQWRIDVASDGRPVGILLREFSLQSQPEGCVVDDATGRLYAGEEKRGVWQLDVAADRAAKPELILPVGRWLHADVEGMGLYRSAAATYLVVSSQGNDSYVVLDVSPAATPANRIRGAFRIGMNLAAGIDGSSETDGLEVLSGHFGPAFANGLLVVQDGHKVLPTGPQNFKYVAWDDVARALGLPLPPAAAAVRP